MALKIVDKSMLEKYDFFSQMKRELEIQWRLDHPNIVKLFEFYEEQRHYCLVQELCKGGDLLDAIVKNGRVQEKIARSLVRTLLSSINYCHKQGIVHRDLKPDNILLEPDLDPTKMKIIDFGTATRRAIDIDNEKAEKPLT